MYVIIKKGKCFLPCAAFRVTLSVWLVCVRIMFTVLKKKTGAELQTQTEQRPKHWLTCCFTHLAWKTGTSCHKSPTTSRRVNAHKIKRPSSYKNIKKYILNVGYLTPSYTFFAFFKINTMGHVFNCLVASRFYNLAIWLILKPRKERKKTISVDSVFPHIKKSADQHMRMRSLQHK